MQILAINGSPRKKGNTSTILEAVLEGARESGAETTHVRLDELDLKGCMGCLSCREKPGFCQRSDGLSPYLEALKTSDGVVVGCPIYMVHVSGQMKVFVDRLYSFYVNRDDGRYDSALPSGKRYAFVTSQGHPDSERFSRAVRWLRGMTGEGLGMENVGEIVHVDSHIKPAKDDAALVKKAHEIGRRLAGQGT
ncbi:flavodoxin family protein [Thermodesulfobacteriota bacterium]